VRELNALAYLGYFLILFASFWYATSSPDIIPLVLLAVILVIYTVYIVGVYYGAMDWRDHGAMTFFSFVMLALMTAKGLPGPPYRLVFTIGVVLVLAYALIRFIERFS